MASLWRSLTLVKPIDKRLGALMHPMLAIWGEREKPEPMPPLPVHAQVSVLPGEDHYGAFSRSDLIVPQVRAFLAVACPAASRAQESAPLQSPTPIPAISRK